MAEDKILQDWVDQDRVRNLAEGLLKKQEQPKVTPDEVVYSDDFVGFAEPVEAEPAPTEAEEKAVPEAPTEPLEPSAPSGEVAAPVEESAPRFGEASATITAELETESAPEAELPSDEATDSSEYLETGVRQPVPMDSPIPDPVVTTTHLVPKPVKLTAPGGSVASPFDLVAPQTTAEEQARLPRSI